MGYEAIENFRQSGDGYLSLPEKISKLTAGTAGKFLKHYKVSNDFSSIARFKTWYFRE